VLREFRTRLVASTAEERFLEAVLDLCKARGWRHPHVDESLPTPLMCWRKFVRLHRAECVGETLRHTLNVLAVVTPDWLGNQVQPAWLERYGHRAEA
jgi:hypothetical protein